MKRRISNKQNKNLPPSPPTLPFIGNLHQLGSIPQQSSWQLSKKHGPVMHLRLGKMLTVVISSAEVSKVVLKTYDLDSCSRPTLQGARTLTYNFQDLAFAPYGEYQREIRKICVLELFSVKRVQTYRSIREEEITKMINSISHHSSSSSPVDLTKKMFALTASIIFRVALEQVSKGVTLIITDLMKLSGLRQRREKVFRDLDAFFQSVIDDRCSPWRTKRQQDDIIDVLLKIVKEQTGFGAALLTEKNIKAFLLVNL
ncbi:hypothetical protein TIFTF001_018230 [Ficus carica]|uniref:Cytochrome P450 n=1 Tax=Ficus carica TaxID=3494 RepID=A0AA88DJ66_FICCA|nr:hypothetical protein TIFTF001_018230 [Ficus carica]